MAIIINNICNRKCSYCFEGDLSTQKPVSMPKEAVAKIIDFIGVDNNNCAIMGGEPLLHPEIAEIISLVGQKTKKPPLILTNGVCDNSIVEKITMKAKASWLFNLNHIDPYSKEEFTNFIKNLKFLIDYGQKVSLAVTITNPEDSFSLLYAVLQYPWFRSHIVNIRIGISTPGRNFTNIFPKRLSYDFGRAYLDIVEKCHKINPRIYFSNECAVNLCFIEEKIYSKLIKVVKHLKTTCVNGNQDILPDYSTYWCPATESIPGLKIDNIFSFDSMSQVKDVLQNRRNKLQQEFPLKCGFDDCHNIECAGSCLAYNYYRKQLTDSEY